MSSEIIKLEREISELAETDISDMEVGDARTFNTESGKRIDLLRTEDGVEIYLDGELIDTGLHGDESLHEGHKVVHRHVEVICDSDEDCEEEGFEVDTLHHEGNHEKIIIIKKEADTD
jgi:hypothetical protein